MCVGLMAIFLVLQFSSVILPVSPKPKKRWNNFHGERVRFVSGLEGHAYRIAPIYRITENPKHWLKTRNEIIVNSACGWQPSFWRQEKWKLRWDNEGDRGRRRSRRENENSESGQKENGEGFSKNTKQNTTHLVPPGVCVYMFSPVHHIVQPQFISHQVDYEHEHQKEEEA